MPVAPTKSQTGVIATRLASVAAVWGLSKLVESKKGKRVAKKIDESIERTQAQVTKNVAKAARHAKTRPGYLSAGLAAIAVGIAFLTQAGRK